MSGHSGMGRIAGALALGALVGGLPVGSSLAAPVLSAERMAQVEQASRLGERLAYLGYFDQAYARYPQLPDGVLEAVAFVGTRWIHRLPASPFDGHHNMPQVYGVMGLQHGFGGFEDVLGQAADALGVSVDQVLSDPRLSILATAALLDAWRAEAGLEEPTVEELAPLLGRLSGIPEGGDINSYARDSYTYDVLLTLERGHDDWGILIPDMAIDWRMAFEPESLQLLRAPSVRVRVDRDRVELYGDVARTETASTDYAPALWDESPNYSSRSGAAITHVALHTIQGSYSGCISWFNNPDADVSAHYVMRSSDGQVTQMVREANKAWHIGSENSYTLGTEHEGYVDTSTYYTTAMYNSSAALTKDMCSSNKIDCSTTYGGASSSSVQVLSSSYHVKGHQHYPNQTHTDPGKYWDWAKFKTLVTGTTTTPTPTTTTVLDSFESSEGHFNTSPTYSGSTVGIATSSTADRSTTAKKNGSYAEQVMLKDNTSSSSSWSVRFLSGSGDPAQNTKLTTSGGRIGFWVYTGGSGMTASIGIDDSDGTEVGVAKSIPVNTWTYLEWKLDDAAQWNAWYNGNGAITSSSVSVDAIWFYRAQTSYTVYVYVDDVTYKK